MRKTLKTNVKRPGQEWAQCGKKISTITAFLFSSVKSQKLSKGPARYLDPKSPLYFHIFWCSTKKYIFLFKFYRSTIKYIFLLN